MNEFLLVFVCTGNICRSPMAEGIMNDFVLDEVENNQIIQIIISSAGTHAITGSPASRSAVSVAKKHGINLDFHRSKPITEVIVRNADLILTMEKNHTEYIKSLWPFCDCVYEIKNYELEDGVTPDHTDIIDPIGMSIEVYSAVFDELNKEINRIKDCIFSMVKEKFEN